MPVNALPGLNAHVFWGAVIGAVLSFLLALAYRGWAILVCFGIFVGIAADVWAHGYDH